MIPEQSECPTLAFFQTKFLNILKHSSLQPFHGCSVTWDTVSRKVNVCIGVETTPCKKQPHVSLKCLIFSIFLGDLVPKIHIPGGYEEGWSVWVPMTAGSVRMVGTVRVPAAQQVPIPGRTPSVKGETPPVVKNRPDNQLTIFLHLPDT